MSLNQKLKTLNRKKAYIFEKRLSQTLLPLNMTIHIVDEYVFTCKKNV